jgi:glycosyltransferase involved in cell wall biosynthesis
VESTQHSPHPDASTVTVVAQAWLDYQPNTFIEPHPYLNSNEQTKSVNMVYNLWENGEPIDELTDYFRKKPLDGMMARNFFNRAVRRIRRNYDWKRFNRHCVKILRREKASVIHLHFGTTACELLPAIRASGLPSVASFYGYDVSAALRSPKTREKYREMFQVVDCFVVLCEEAKRRLVELGCSEKKIRVWNMPAGVEKYPFRPRTKSNKTLRLLMGARFAESKGHIYLFKAMKTLIDEGLDLSLTMVGYGDTLPLIKKQISKLGLKDRIRIIDTEARSGFSTLLRSLTEEHDIFVQPSITSKNGTDEGGPALTMVCAQAAGMPVICTRFPGSEISIIDGKTGLFCTERDSKSLAEAIRSLAGSSNSWEEMGATGSRLVREEFSEKIQMNKLLAIYREISGEKNPGDH